MASPGTTSPRVPFRQVSFLDDGISWRLGYPEYDVVSAIAGGPVLLVGALYAQESRAHDRAEVTGELLNERDVTVSGYVIGAGDLDAIFPKQDGEINGRFWGGTKCQGTLVIFVKRFGRWNASWASFESSGSFQGVLRSVGVAPDQPWLVQCRMRMQLEGANIRIARPICVAGGLGCYC